MGMMETANDRVWSWARDSACVRHLEDACVVRVVGDDAVTWLNGQTSNDTSRVDEDTAVYALSLDAKGRIQSDLWVAADGEQGRVFVAPASAVEALLEAMDRYIIMEDVELEVDDGLAVITVQGPKAAEVVQAAPAELRRVKTVRLGAGGFDLWVPKEALEGTLSTLKAAAQAQGGGLADAQGWVDAHVAAGVPRYGADFGAKVYPQEVGLKQRAVSFNKGCYLGQEVVCMLENRGKLARRLVQLEGSGDAAARAGAQVLSTDGSRVGEVTSAAAGPTPLALALVKSAHAERGTPLRIDDTDWKVVADAG